MFYLSNIGDFGWSYLVHFKATNFDPTIAFFCKKVALNEIKKNSKVGVNNFNRLATAAWNAFHSRRKRRFSKSISSYSFQARTSRFLHSSPPASVKTPTWAFFDNLKTQKNIIFEMLLTRPSPKNNEFWCSIFLKCFMQNIEKSPRWVIHTSFVLHV